MDGAANVTMSRIEVPMGEAVAHARDVAPRVAWLGIKQVVGNGLDRFADLDEADPDGVEDQAVGQIAPCDMTLYAAMASRMSFSLSASRRLIRRQRRRGRRHGREA